MRLLFTLPQRFTMLPLLCITLHHLCITLHHLCTTPHHLCTTPHQQFTTLPTMLLLLLPTTCQRSTMRQLTMVFASWLTLSPMQWPTPLHTMQWPIQLPTMLLPTMPWPTPLPTILLTLSCTLLQSSTVPPTASL